MNRNQDSKSHTCKLFQLFESCPFSSVVCFPLLILKSQRYVWVTCPGSGLNAWYFMYFPSLLHFTWHYRYFFFRSAQHNPRKSVYSWAFTTVYCCHSFSPCTIDILAPKTPNNEEFSCDFCPIFPALICDYILRRTAVQGHCCLFFWFKIFHFHIFGLFFFIPLWFMQNDVLLEKENPSMSLEKMWSCSKHIL